MNSPKSCYQITLHPLGSFFFGGEVVFGEQDGQSRRKSYLVHSRYLPQQTTLLGMLRETLLRQNGLLLDHDSPDTVREAAAKLVGNTGFDIHHSKEGDDATNRGFGSIECISPLFLLDSHGKTFQPGPFDDVKGKDGNACDYASDSPVVYLQGYDPKQGLSFTYHDGEGNGNISLSECFAKEERTGITVTNRKDWRETETDQEAFYRQTRFRNNHSACKQTSVNSSSLEPPSSAYGFRFWAKINYPLESAVVVMGGERSAFYMDVKTSGVVDDFQSLLHPVSYQHPKTLPSGYRRCVLLSDTYLSPELFRKLNVFAVAETISFRYFSTSLRKTKDFYALGDRKQLTARRQSPVVNLLVRGSVLYVPKEHINNLTAAIEAEQKFRAIGYNYYQIA